MLCVFFIPFFVCVSSFWRLVFGVVFFSGGVKNKHAEKMFPSVIAVERDDSSYILR